MSSHPAGRPAAAEPKPLLPLQQQKNGVPPDADGRPPDNADGRRSRSITWLANLGFVLFILNCGLYVYCSQCYHFSILYSQMILLALLVCLKRYEKAEPRSQLRDRLKLAVWLFTTVHNISFSYMVAIAMPPAVAVVACLVVFGAAAGGVYYL